MQAGIRNHSKVQIGAIVVMFLLQGLLVSSSRAIEKQEDMLSQGGESHRGGDLLLRTKPQTKRLLESEDRLTFDIAGTYWLFDQYTNYPQSALPVSGTGAIGPEITLGYSLFSFGMRYLYGKTWLDMGAEDLSSGSITLFDWAAKCSLGFIGLYFGRDYFKGNAFNQDMGMIGHSTLANWVAGIDGRLPIGLNRRHALGFDLGYYFDGENNKGARFAGYQTLSLPSAHYKTQGLRAGLTYSFYFTNFPGSIAAGLKGVGYFAERADNSPGFDETYHIGPQLNFNLHI